MPFSFTLDMASQLQEQSEPRWSLIVDDSYIEHMSLGRINISMLPSCGALTQLGKPNFIVWFFRGPTSNWKDAATTYCTVRSRGLASNLVLYDTAPGEMAQAFLVGHLSRFELNKRFLFLTATFPEVWKKQDSLLGPVFSSLSFQLKVASLKKSLL